MLHEFIYISSLFIISIIYNYIINLFINYLFINYYIHNVIIVFLILVIQIDNLNLLNDLNKIKNDKDNDRFINIICIQAAEIQKYKLLIENIERNKKILKKYSSAGDLSL